MATGFNHLMNTPQTAIGKGTVGEPSPAPEGKEGLEFRVALFFDGTMNNRTNSEVRIGKHDQILDDNEKNMLSSYANFLSNVAILEYMNTQNDPTKQQVSVYVEGIGTVDFVEGAIKKDKHGKEVKGEDGLPVLLTDAENSNDQKPGYAFGSGTTGIVQRVTKGIREAKTRIKKAYNDEEQYIKKITVDVIGFSRGAAAARHFVARRNGLQGPWLQPDRPELEINFVGLFETVSSFEPKEHVMQNAGKAISGKIFTKNVQQLSLDLHGVPKRVVHLTSQDEMRYNFSLTTIDSSLRAGKGFQVSLPGVHSDIGGGYPEPDPLNLDLDPNKPSAILGKPSVRDLNKEQRMFTSHQEQLALVREGWYTDGSNGTPNQIVPFNFEQYRQYRTTEDYWTERARKEGWNYLRQPYTGRMCGLRYLANQYQYLTLYLMLGLATKKLDKGGKDNLVMVFESLETDENRDYKVPPDLEAIQAHFADRIKEKSGSDAPDNALRCQNDAQLHWLRNKYLHRSSVLYAESEIANWAAYKRAPKDTRMVISDADNVASARPVEVPDLINEPVQVD